MNTSAPVLPLETRLLTEIAEIRKSVGSLDKTTIRQQVILEEHMRRTAQLETALLAHFQEDTDRFAAMHGALAPLERHVSMWAGAGKLLAITATVAGVVAGLWKLFG